MAVRYNEWKITFKTIVGNLFSGKEDSTNVPLRDQPARRSVGAIPDRVDVLRRMVGQEIVGHDARHDDHGPVPRHVQGVPAQPGLRLAQRGEGVGGIAGGRKEELTVGPGRSRARGTPCSG